MAIIPTSTDFPQRQIGSVLRILTRVADNWSGEQIEQKVRQRSAGRAIVREWAASRSAGKSERWAMPAGVNYRTQE